jgi:hypothetical protein
MEKKKTIQELISALQTLRLEEAELTAQLEEALNNEGEQGYTTNKQTAVVTNREERRNTNRNLAGGDRIRIKNRLHKPANWNNDIEWVESEGKNATVTEVLTKGTSIQVHFITDNGVRTWRAPNNVQLLTASTHQHE